MEFLKINVYCTKTWKPILFIMVVTSISIMSVHHGLVYFSFIPDKTNVVDSSQDYLCGNSSLTNIFGLNSYVCKAKLAKRTFQQAKGSFIFYSKYTSTSSWPSTPGLNRTFLPGIDSMDKYLKLPPIVNAMKRDPENEAWQKRDYKFLISYNATCSSLRSNHQNKSNSSWFDFDNDVFVLVTIKSSCGNEFRRKAIRGSWGNEKWILEHLSVRIKVVFLLGKCKFEEQTMDLHKESELHKDILQWDFVDSFRNLTLKQFLLWQWYATHCMEIPFLFQGDDDILGNTVNIVNRLLSTPIDSEQNLWHGSGLFYNRPIRDKTSRYYVSKALYSEERYPPYVSGGGYFISGYLVARVFLETLKTRIISVDDAFLGILANAVGVSPVNDSTFASWGLDKPTPQNISKVTSYHRVMPFPMITMWDDLVDYYLSNAENL